MFQTWPSPASSTKAGADPDSGKPVNLSFRHTNDNAAYSSALKCRYLSGDPKVRSATIAVANPFPPETVSPVAPPDQRAGIGIGGVHGREPLRRSRSFNMPAKSATWVSSALSRADYGNASQSA